MDTSLLLGFIAALVAFLLGVVASKAHPDKKLCPIAYGFSWCAVAGMMLMSVEVDSIPNQLIGFALLGLGVVGLTIRFSQGGKYYVPR